mmetsp:Transcript_41835/g.61904  ORF Transcript_41835/g.61904 Transcript_41835/m.61904 type:complete len:332 (-) Transcript_41835:243-1238(-)|eukprot:CAMPEP_0194046206 /NCGR_PEP_ID=MMETSP0009_2-20130614/20044_1 /TAXON_ID=210454 /ORGANISM="Grammatophora oceanica, Strain CCMP 410" /LENGTH=331 /DNA_ID=CAMNT_0038691407 /DNA_START=96 /DNA_END=1091 /DNA_ORIENTATION=+
MKILSNVVAIMLLSLDATQARDKFVKGQSSSIQKHDDPANDERNLGSYSRSQQKKKGFKDACNECENLKFSSYDPPPELGFLSFITDAIYDSDDASCLLLTLVKTAREAICFILDEEGVPNPDAQGIGPQAEGVSALSEQLASAGLSAGPQGSTPMALEETFLSFVKPIDGDANKIIDFFTENVDDLNSFVGTRRELQGDILPPDTDPIWKEIIPVGFFIKCDILGVPDDVCGVLFALFTTQDAIMCKFTQEQGCTIDHSCTEQLKFDIEYNARRIATIIPLPPFFDTIVGEILAPCGSCINFKNPCAPFCSFARTFHDCDPYLRLAIDFA